MPSADAGILLDTGVLVAILSEADPRHGAATRWLAQLKARLHTVDAVLTETSFFLPAERRALLAEMAATGAVQIHQPDGSSYTRVGSFLRKYADLRPDWADATLVWLAEQTGIHRIATLDVRDFSAYRIHGRSKFLIEPIA